jgi:hypothetical protein
MSIHVALVGAYILGLALPAAAQTTTTTTTTTYYTSESMKRAS